MKNNSKNRESSKKNLTNTWTKSATREKKIHAVPYIKKFNNKL
jgi:hypothetical protein